MVKRFIKWLGILILVLLGLLLLLLHGVSGFFRGGDDQVRDHFDSVGYSYEIHEEQIRDREIRWITTGAQQNNRAILFLHGAPGSWKDFSQYLIDPDLQQSMYMIAMDRPGYGYSDYGNAETSITLIGKSPDDPSSSRTGSYGHR